MCERAPAPRVPAPHLGSRVVVQAEAVRLPEAAAILPRAHRQERERVTSDDGTPVKSPLNASTCKALKQRATMGIMMVASHQGDPGSSPGRATPGFSQMAIVPEDITCRRVFSGIARFTRPCITALFHSHLISLSPALKTSFYGTFPTRQAVVQQVGLPELTCERHSAILLSCDAGVRNTRHHGTFVFLRSPPTCSYFPRLRSRSAAATKATQGLALSLDVRYWRDAMGGCSCTPCTPLRAPTRETAAGGRRSSRAPSGGKHLIAGANQLGAYFTGGREK
ncbi:hypothetical protein PR048_021978 [Dryococelus australis]|uniref:Uncharacterized protein n=1 Tax=Dryococelus australis TaxID=614101 RepID=A0ABQ9GZX1_9NEOP|nr:hypothetical protein PR048_021978 [Dryococelus australis]